MDLNSSERYSRGRLQVMLRALSHRNYRLFFAGQSISLLGTWMQQIAMNWLVYYLTNSTFMLGVVGFMGTLPLFLLAPIGGVWADRWDRRRTLLITQVMLMLQALLLAVLALTEVIAVWQILVLSALDGVVNAVDGAIRSAFLPEIVENKEDLGSAIALSSLVQNGTRMLGPPLAGVLIALMAKQSNVEQGSGICFLLNGLSFLAVCAALAAMHTHAFPTASVPISMLRDLKEGIAYAFREPPIRDLLLIQALVGLVGVPYTLLPVVAREILHGGPDTLGLLMGFTAVGSLSGSIFLASRREQRGSIRRIAASGLVLSVALIGFAFARELWISLGFRIVIGLTMMLIMTGGFTLLQIIVAVDKRGRVISLYLVAALGMNALGNLLLASLAGWLGVPAAFVMSGACCLVGFLWFAARIPVLRPMIEESGAAANDAPEMRRPMLSLFEADHQ